MSIDFKANQIRASQIIASGSTLNSSLIVYGKDSATNFTGGTSFPGASIGTDIFLYVSGALGKRGQAGTNGTAVFGGDLFISGSTFLGTDSSNSVTFNAQVSSDIIPDSDRTRNLGSSSSRFANIYTGDLHLRNDRGDYTLIEEEDCLTIRFNKSGKRYRFLLERAPEFDE